MKKQNNIRKKALDFARKGEWAKALAEFQRLVDVERQNPNLFNEIGDLHLKLSDKREAFKSYHEAVDAYSKIGLNNNAVAVCKKILRFNPTDNVVCGKLAKLRHQQGFHREAVSYSLTFLDRLLESTDVPPEGVRELVVDIAGAAGDQCEILERAVDYLLRCDFNDDAGVMLDKLYALYTSRGDTENIDRLREKMKTIGHTPAPMPDSDGTQTMDRLETVESHRNHFDARATEAGHERDGSVPPNIKRGCEEDVAKDFGVVDIEAPVSGGADTSRGERECDNGGDTWTQAETAGGGGYEPKSSTYGSQTCPTQTAEEPGESSDEEYSKPVKEYVIPDEHIDDSGSGELASDEEGLVQTSDIVGQYASEVKADVDEDDYRSHYDLGMAYLEMGLVNEAIREFQYASSSSLYQVRSLEMIGRCFIEQDQPELAVKQLTRGLSFVGEDNLEALGIKYSLGLAYEMIGDLDKAKSYFEDVYVIDVTFRDVEEKMNKYTP